MDIVLKYGVVILGVISALLIFVLIFNKKIPILNGQINITSKPNSYNEYLEGERVPENTRLRSDDCSLFDVMLSSEADFNQKSSGKDVIKCLNHVWSKNGE